jgi:DNA-nicking Smr family endonuclease
MAKKHGSDSTQPGDEPEEPGLFRRLMADAKPLSQAPRAEVPRRVNARARFRRENEREVLRESMDHDPRSAGILSGDGLLFHRTSVGRRTLRKLARGGFTVQSELDLHGMTASQAATALRDFVNESCRRKISCVRIVHGKGLGSGSRGPVLKREVDSLLRRWDQVLAFVSARQVDGGTGAVYVLLKTE